MSTTSVEQGQPVAKAKKTEKTEEDKLVILGTTGLRAGRLFGKVAKLRRDKQLATRFAFFKASRRRLAEERRRKAEQKRLNEQLLSLPEDQREAALAFLMASAKSKSSKGKAGKGGLAGRMALPGRPVRRK